MIYDMDSATKIAGAFTVDQAAQLTGLSADQLRRWDREGFFQPSMAYENRRAPFSRIYTFRDLVGLRAISRLMSEHGVSKQYLTRVKHALNRPHEMWGQTTLYVLGKKLYLQEPESKDLREPTTGQKALRYFPLQPVVGEIEEGIRRLSDRSRIPAGAVARNRNVMANTEVLEGTRIPIGTILEYHRDGYSVDDIVRAYPSLRREDIEIVVKRAGGRAA
jgi:uncharacterized protein (DUF433 family)